MSEIRVKQPRFLHFFTRTGETVNVRSNILPAIMLIGAFILWILSLPNIDPGQMNDLGLVSVLPITFFAALFILAASFLILLHRDGNHEGLLLLHVLLLILILHGTPQIVYGTLRYSWAWKHVGIVDFIQRNGSVNPSITDLNAYHNWPGFFALTAFYNQLAGIQSSLSYAGWGPVFFNLLDLGALLIIYRSLSIDRRLVWLSIWFFYLFNWVGQDYFSPQALSFFLYLVTIAILLRWFRVGIGRSKILHQIVPAEDEITSPDQAELDRSASNGERSLQINAWKRLLIMSFLILILIAIVSTHQLTPLMILSALTLLVISKIINQRYLIILTAVLTVVWVSFMAVGFLNGNLYWIVRSIGSLLDNISGNLIDLTIASPGQQIVAYIDRIMSALVWVLALFGLYRRYRSGQWDLTAILLAIAPLPMVLLNAYGGEMLFRAYLFSLPFVTFLAASLFYPTPRSGTSFRTPLLAVLTSFVLIPGFLFSYYGKERMYYFSPEEVAGAQFVFENAPQGALIVDSTWNWPRQYTRYEQYDYHSLVNLTEAERSEINQNVDVALPRLMDMDDYPAAFLVINRSQIAEADMSGIFITPDWLPSFLVAMSQSERFEVVFYNPHVIVYQYTN